MRAFVAFVAVAASLVLTPVATGYAPAFSQDFSITNQEEPADPARRDLMRELQAWWEVHAYYPKEAAQSDVGGTVKVHLSIRPDGNIFMVRVVESSGSRSIDRAGFTAFHGGFVRPFPEGANAQQIELDLALHYVLAHRHNEPLTAGYTPTPPKSRFTISNDQVQTTVVDVLLQRTCTGLVVKDGIQNHPIYGRRSWAEATFFHKPDGTPWVKFWEGGILIVASVREEGKSAKWTGREEGKCTGPNGCRHALYTVWADGDNHLIGKTDIIPGTVDLTCTAEVAPPITNTSWWETTRSQPSYAFMEPESVIYMPGYIPPSNRSP